MLAVIRRVVYYVQEYSAQVAQVVGESILSGSIKYGMASELILKLLGDISVDILSSLIEDTYHTEIRLKRNGHVITEEKREQRIKKKRFSLTRRIRNSLHINWNF